MKAAVALVLLALVTTACVGSDSWSAVRRYDLTLPATGIAHLVLRGDNGDVLAHAASVDRIEVRAVLHTPDESDLATDSVTLAKQGDQATVLTNCRSRFAVFWNIQDCGVDYTITYPRSLAASFTVSNGDVEVDGAATVEARTTNGDVTLREATGNVTAESHEGDVTASLAPGWSGASLSFATTFGDVDLRVPPGFHADVHVVHPLAGDERGTGDIPLGSVTLYAHTVFGDIDVRRV